MFLSRVSDQEDNEYFQTNLSLVVNNKTLRFKLHSRKYLWTIVNAVNVQIGYVSNATFDLITYINTAQGVNRAESTRYLLLFYPKQWSTEGQSIRRKPKFFIIWPSALAIEVLF